MTSFTITADSTTPQQIYAGEIGIIDVGVTLTEIYDPINLNAPLIYVGTDYLPISLMVNGTIVSTTTAITTPITISPGMNIGAFYNNLMIHVSATGSVLQSGVAGSPDASAIAIDALGYLGIVNHGVIQGDTAITSFVLASGSYGDATTGIVDHSGFGFHLNNTGTVVGLESHAIYLGSFGQRENGIATIVNRGLIDAQSAGRAVLGGEERDLIENWATISAASGMALSLNAGADHVINYGSITGDVRLGDDDDILHNDGLLTGDVMLGTGDDFFSGGNGVVSAKVYGDDGADVFHASHSATADWLFGGDGNDSFFGFQGNDSISGDNGTDTMQGDAGNDVLNGNAGNDSLRGSQGADTLIGGLGADTLTGGVGNDTFRFATLPSAGDDITDFSAISGNNDRFQIDASAFGGGLTLGTLAVSKFQSRADNLAQQANDRFIFNTTDETLWFDANGNAAGGLTMVADMQAGAVVTAADIILI